MDRAINKKVVLAAQLVLLLVPLIAFADPLAPSPKFENPLGDVITIDKFLTNITTFLLGATGLIAMLAVVWGGLQYILSFGNEQKISAAKRVIFWAIGGMVVVGLSYAILRSVASLLGLET